MGFPLSPILADIVMQDLEVKAIKNLDFEIPVYYRYVDDNPSEQSRHNFKFLQ